MATLTNPQISKYIISQIEKGQAIVFDEIIFANIPNLTESNLNRYLTIPSNNQIVYRQAISQTGFINENAVVYSVTMGTEVGNFDFNFIGLINKSENLLAVAVQTDLIKKIKNQNNQQGNSITRSILIEFNGAKAATNITIPAQTWQIDFTARLKGIDEKIRLSNLDLFGEAVFFGEGFLAKKTNTARRYTIESGTAYVKGVRATTARQTYNASNLPTTLYLDVVHQNTVTGSYETLSVITESRNRDYIDTAGYQHYVTPIARLESNGNVTDLRPLYLREIQDGLNNKVNRTGDTVTGDLILDQAKNGRWSALYLKSNNGDYRFEASPVDNNPRLNIVHRVGEVQNYLRFREFKSETFVAYESWVRAGFAPLANPNFTGTISGNYRLVIDGNEAEYTPYINIKDSSVDISRRVTDKVIAEITASVANGNGKNNRSLIRTMINSAKHGNLYAGVYNADNTVRWLWSGFGETGNLSIGKTSDDKTNRLQVNGTIYANAPLATANNGQVPTTAWVRSYSSNLISDYLPLTGGTLTGNLILNNNGNFPRIQFKAGDNSLLTLHSVEANTQHIATISKENASGERIGHLWFPKRVNETIATTTDVQNAESRAKTEAANAKTAADNAKTTADNAQRTATAAAGTAAWSGVSGKPSFNSNVNSTADNQFATPKAVKAAYDRASTAVTNAANAKTAADNAKTAADNAQRTANGKANASHTHTYNQISNFAAGVAAQFGQSNAQTGWTKLPNGLIIQWGRSTGTSPVKFPLKFPNACYTVVHSHNATHVHDFGNSIIIGDTTTTEFKFYSWGNTAYVNWIAIGR